MVVRVLPSLAGSPPDVCIAGVAENQVRGWWGAPWGGALFYPLGLLGALLDGCAVECGGPTLWSVPIAAGRLGVEQPDLGVEEAWFPTNQLVRARAMGGGAAGVDANCMGGVGIALGAQIPGADLPPSPDSPHLWIGPAHRMVSIPAHQL